MKILLSVVLFCLIIYALFYFFRLPKTIYLISKVQPYEQKIDTEKAILVLGDSTGYGTGASKSSDSVAGRIGLDFPEYSIKNNSQNGRTVGELLPIALEIETQYDFILLQIGGNDILQKRDLKDVEFEIRTIITHLSKQTDRLFMMTSGNVGAAAAFEGEQAKKYEILTREYRDMILQVANDTPLTYIDLFQEPEDDVFLKEPKKYLSIDGLHPSSAGYDYWYTPLRTQLQLTLP